MQGRYGFSLIELLVVIAIVALLSAVAVPLYKDYTLRASLSKFYTIAGNFIQEDIKYYAANGVWADLSDLYPEYVTYFELNPVNVSDLLTRIEVDNGEVSAACNYSSVLFSLDSSKFGNAFDDSNPEQNGIVYTFGETPSGAIIIGCAALPTNSQNLIDAVAANCPMTAQDVLDITCP